MTLIELKNAILADKAPNDFIIFVCQENTFIANQYVDTICVKNNLVRKNISSLASEESAVSLITNEVDSLNVLTTDTFEESADDYSAFTNTVVICSKIDKKVKPLVEDYIIEIPKLLDWQIKDYINTVCPGLDQLDIDWLYEATGGNIYRINNELDKVLLFPDKHKEILNELRYDPGSDLVSLTSYKLADAIINRNKLILLDYFEHKKAFMNIEPLALVGLLLTKAKQILLITQNSGKTAAEIGCSSAQYNYILKNCRGFSSEYLGGLIRSLSSIDLKLKSGLLEMSKSALLDYIICRALS